MRTSESPPPAAAFRTRSHSFRCATAFNPRPIFKMVLLRSAFGFSPSSLTVRSAIGGTPDRREGIAQLSLLETALWPLQGGKLPGNQFQTTYDVPTPAGRTTATVTVRAGLGLQPTDERILWGLLGATLSRPQADPVLLATPVWLLQHPGLDTGGTQSAARQEALLRLAVRSYQNTGFYNPETRDHEYAAFQFLRRGFKTVVGRLSRAVRTALPSRPTGF